MQRRAGPPNRRPADYNPEAPMIVAAHIEPPPCDRIAAFYRRVLATLCDRDVPFLIGGAYSIQVYTGITRHTKDIDLFVHPHDCERTLEVLADAGYRTELTFTHWLGKVHGDDAFADIIFSSGNGIAVVDDVWFAHSVPAEVLGVAVQLCPPEETIWSKAFIMERERFDGADIAHLLRACADRLDWRRLLRRFGTHWRVLLSHLILFGYAYPDDRRRIPAWVMHDLIDGLETEMKGPAPATGVCQGTLLSREQYLTDLTEWGYQDARLPPHGTMTAEEVAVWTEAIERK